MRTHAMRLMQAALAVAGSLLLGGGAAAQTTIEYYHTDALGSVRVVTDAAGNLLRQHDYWPFGAEVNPPPNECTDVRDPRGFTGQQRDKETCQDYFGGRYYRSGTRADGPPRASGRFTSPDPVMNIDAAIADPQAWNRYTYVRNRPQVLVDPDGRDPVTVGAAIGAVVFGGWAVYSNVSQGRPWYAGVGVEAAKGLLVGATLGVAGPALLPSTIPTGAATAATAGARVASGAADRIAQTGEGVIVRFGNNANQTFHSFRHVDAEGYDVQAVANVITQQLQAVGSSIPVGQARMFVGSAGGRDFVYRAYRLSTEVVSVGRITPG